MPRLFVVALTVGLAWVVVTVSGTHVAQGPALSGLFPLALALAMAFVAGELMARVHLPRVTGYLLTGILCGPQVAGLITMPVARDLQPINALAVAVIAFIAGVEMNLARIRPLMRQILTLSSVLLLLLYGGLFAAVWLAWPWLGIAPHLEGMQRMAAAALVTTVVVSFSPTVTIAIITESRAAGPLSELTLAVVIVADLILIVLFTLMMQGAHLAFGGPRESGLLSGLAWEILGSFAVGAAAGLPFAFYLQHARRELPFACVAFCAALAALSVGWGLESLLAALAAGLVVANAAPQRGPIVKRAIELGALPVLIVFFATAGASLRPDAVVALGLVAVAVSAIRMFLIWVAAGVGTSLAGTPKPIARLVWMGFVSQAGVTLGLTLIVAAEFPAWGSTMQTLMVALIAIHELIGPVLFRTALARAGEVGRGYL
jgi:Kef-type K+ transport system membrane component KefB